jgi:hypothetical protein
VEMEKLKFNMVKNAMIKTWLTETDVQILA